MSGKEKKRKLFGKRKRRQCFYCGKRLAFHLATVDHVKPLSKGGYDRMSNVVISCGDCNRAKGNKDIMEFLKSLNWRRQSIKERKDKA